MYVNKALSNVRKNMTHKFIKQKHLERAYLSSGDKVSKSPAIKKTSFKLDLKRNNSSDKKTITPRNQNNNNHKNSNLQLSVLVLTNELLSGKATGEFKSKSFQMLMNRIFQKIHLSISQLSKSQAELKESKSNLYNSILPAISENQDATAQPIEHMDIKQIKQNVVEPL